MTTKEKMNYCEICMDSIETISPSEGFESDCVHYACKECWKQVKNKCPYCRRELPIGFPRRTNEENREILREWIDDRVPLSVTELYLRNNRIVDLTSLASLVNLTELYLGGNRIVDLTPISNLSSLTNLTKLYLGGNRIVDLTPISNLSSLTHLTVLDLGGNRIVDKTLLSSLINTRIYY